MAEKVLLIDGYSILNRAFYGVPPLTNSKGVPTNAVYGFLNILFKIIDNEQPKYAAVAFDLKAPTFRHKMYDAYKGTRKGMPDELHAQVPVIKEILTAMGIEHLSCEGYEADDIMGTVAKKCEAMGLDVMILSGDRDILQLVTEHITQRLPKTVKGVTTIENYTPEKIKEVYGITPLQIIDLKAMMGDSSDNIPGLPGVGEKTASNLLALYGSLENAKAHVDEIKPKKAHDAFAEHYELGELSKVLATIITDAPIEFELDKLKLGNLFNDEAYVLFKEYEFKNLYPRFTGSEKKTLPIPEISYISSAMELELNKHKLVGKEAAFCADVYDDKLYGVALAYDEVIEYIPSEGLIPSDVIAGLINSMNEKEFSLATFGLKEALKYLDLDNAHRIFDTLIGAYLINPLKSEYSYEQIGSEYGNVSVPAPEEVVKSKITKSVKLTQEQREKITAYKAYAALKAKETLGSELNAQGMYELFKEIEMPLVVTLDAMEKEGIMLDKAELLKYSNMLAESIGLLEKDIYEAAGEEFNINSPKQLGVILFEKLGLKGGKKTKSGYSTAADVLEKLAEESPVVSKILSYRQLTKLKSTYADALSSYCDENSRIHTHFQQTVTATGRLSSTEPNLQNIPVRMELGREIRKVFIPKPGHVLIDADYSQIELRVMAHLSGDKMLIEAYRNADDIHAITASQVFDVPLEEVTPLQRRSAKAVNFGIIYGISSFGLGQDLNISSKEAKAYIDKYFMTYPGIKAFLDQTVKEAKENGYTTTMYGRRRPIPELSSSNFMQRSFGERAAMNSPIQGTAADIIKIAMNRVYKALKESGLNTRLILQVHDELLLEVPENEVEEAKAILEREMMNAAELLVPLDVDVKSGSNWNDAH